MSIQRNAIANYLGQGWAAIMGIAFIPLYVRVLGVESYGLIGFFAVLQGAMQLLDFGLTPTLNREFARLASGGHTPQSIRNLLRSVEAVCAVIAVVMVALISAASSWIAETWLNAAHLPAPVVSDAVRIMGLVLAARWLEQLYRAALLGIGDHIWLNVAQAGLATLRWGGAYLVIVLATPTVAAFFIWQGAISLLSIAVLMTRTYRVMPKAEHGAWFELSSLRGIWRFASGMFAGSILAFLLTQIDKLAISKLLPLEQLGYYMVAAAAAGGVSQLIAPMNAAVFPVLTDDVARADHEGLKRNFIRACQWLAAIIVPPAMVLAFFPEAVLLLWTGNPPLVAATAPLLTVIVLATLCNGLMNLPYMLQLAHGWTSLAVYINSVAVAIMIPVTLWAVPRYGAIGAATAYLALNVTYIVVGAQLMFRRLLPTSKHLWLSGAILAPVAAGGAAAFALRWVIGVPATRVGAAVTVTLAAISLPLAVVLATPHVRESIVNLVRPCRTWLRDPW
jgi:O-antigen/teichoic acid export membrane protein